MSQFDIRQRRNPFRRKIFSSRDAGNKDVGFLQSSSIISFINTFKSSPTIVNPDYLALQRPIFPGACSQCAPQSGATMINAELSALRPLRNVLQKHITPAAQVALPTFDDRHETQLSLQSLESFVLQDEHVCAVLELCGESIEPLSRLKLMLPTACCGNASWLRQLIHLYLGRLIPRGLIYHSGQLEILSRSQLAGSPLLFINLGETLIDGALLQQVLLHHNSSKIHSILVTANDDIIWSKSMLNMFGFSGGMRAFVNVQSDLDWSVQHATFRYLLSEGWNLVVNAKDSATSEQLIWTILSHIVEHVANQIIPDVQVVPVSISYDVSMELTTMSASWFEVLKQMLHLKTVNNSSIRVDIDQPFSLNAFIQNQSKFWPNKRPDKVLLQHLKWSINSLHRFSSTELLSFCVVYPFDEGSTIRERFQKLRDTLFDRKRDFSFSGNTEDVVDHATSLLHPLLQVLPSGHVLPSSVEASKRLTQNCKQVVRAFFNDAVVAVALQSVLQICLQNYVGTHAKVIVNGDKLAEQSDRLFVLLHQEFGASPPCQTLDKLFESGLESLKIQEIISQETVFESQHFQDVKTRRMALSLEIESGELGASCLKGNSNLYHVSLSSESVNKLKFLSALLAPTILRYYKVISTLKQLTVSDDGIPWENYIELTQAGSSYDVCSVLDRLTDLGILTEDAYLVQLASAWKVKPEALNSFIYQVNEFVLSSM